MSPSPAIIFPPSTILQRRGEKVDSTTNVITFCVIFSVFSNSKRVVIFMCLWSPFSSQCRIEKQSAAETAACVAPVKHSFQSSGWLLCVVVCSPLSLSLTPPPAMCYPGCLNKTCSAEKEKKLQYSARLASTPPVFRINISWFSKFLGLKSQGAEGEVGGGQATVWDSQRIIINQAGTRLFFFWTRPCEASCCFKVFRKGKWQIQTILIYVQIWLEKARRGKSWISAGQNLASSNFVDIYIPPEKWVGGWSLFFYRLLVTLTDRWDRQRMTWNKAGEATFKADSQTNQTSCSPPESVIPLSELKKGDRKRQQLLLIMCFAVSQTSFSCKHGLRLRDACCKVVLTHSVVPICRANAHSLSGNTVIS